MAAEKRCLECGRFSKGSKAIPKEVAVPKVVVSTSSSSDEEMPSTAASTPTPTPAPSAQAESAAERPVAQEEMASTTVIQEGPPGAVAVAPVVVDAPDAGLQKVPTAPEAAVSEALATAGPTVSDDADPTKIVAAVGIILDRMAIRATELEAEDGPQPKRLTRFHSAAPPKVGMRPYLARISAFFGCSKECYVLGLIYIDRLLKRHPRIAFDNLTGHRLLITAMLLATKNHDDIFRTNAYYAKVGGVTVKELNALEKCFLLALDWKLHVPSEEYERYCGFVDSLPVC
jgi:hypothetical protein